MGCGEREARGEEGLEMHFALVCGGIVGERRGQRGEAEGVRGVMYLVDNKVVSGRGKKWRQ